MIDKRLWMEEVIGKLKGSFGTRLLFAGLQGSYQRDEADEASDFDVVMVLDGFTAADLKIYRSIIKTMPESQKACGFVCGRADLLNWPKHELFQLERDTEGYFGSLARLLPDFDESDIRNGVKIAAAGLYHAACHQYLFGGGGAGELKQLYKPVFFILRLTDYLRSGHYSGTKAGLLGRLAGEEKELLDISVRWDAYEADARARPDAYYDRLITWCQKAMRGPLELAAK